MARLVTRIDPAEWDAQTLGKTARALKRGGYVAERPFVAYVGNVAKGRPELASLLEELQRDAR